MPDPTHQPGINVGDATLYRLADIALEPMSPLLSRQFVTGSQAMLARILLKKGCVVPEHSHPNEQIAFVLSGALEFVVAGIPQVVRAGEILVIPGNVPHSATALEDTEDLDLFAPPRQDWIDKDDAYLRQPSAEA
jgi:quercetin dioxygenase-like cupin family protein